MSFRITGWDAMESPRHGMRWDGMAFPRRTSRGNFLQSHLHYGCPLGDEKARQRDLRAEPRWYGAQDHHGVRWVGVR